LGREFAPDEEQPDAQPVSMVSHAFWQDRLGGNRDLASLSLILNGESHAVVGVLPGGFQLPGFGSTPILTPLPLDPSHPGFWGNHNTQVFGRLGDGVSLERANGEMAAIAARLEQAYPDWNEGIGSRLVPVREQIVQGARGNLWILFGAVGFVLLIACTNIASLLLARATEAEREMAVRTALGAHRSRIVRLVLSEALLLSAAGGLLGLWVCHLGVDAIQAWAPGNIPRLGEVSVNAQVLGFTLAVSLGTGLLFGLLPALCASRVDVESVLKEGGRTAGGRHHRAQRLFVVSEVALSVVLLVGSGLLLRTFENLLEVEPGFELQGRVAMHVSLPQASYQGRSGVTGFLARLHEELDAIPGVQASGSSVGLPFQGLMWRKLMTLEDRPAATMPEVPVVDLSIVTP
ncbi:MAG: FtsX-like permease family protein, partial [Gemmatimonadetes bacterium]|nr:FtsX-like permease family protein [Gemmatimonadota bacterium]